MSTQTIAEAVDVQSKYLGMVTVEGHHMHSWRIKVTYASREFSFKFFTGTGHGVTPPRPGDVLYSLQSDASMGDYSFVGFCLELGYDTDSRKAHNVWRACRRIRKGCARLFGADLDIFQEEDFDA
jgi:hypothetical protein